MYCILLHMPVKLEEREALLEELMDIVSSIDQARGRYSYLAGEYLGGR